MHAFPFHLFRCAPLAIAMALAATPAQASVVMNATRFVYPFLLAAWRIRGHLRHDSGDLWRRAANYHSRTPRFNARYRSDLIRRATRWTTWLDSHYPTHDATLDVDSLRTEVTHENDRTYPQP